MLEKINITKIFVEQVSTFKKYGSDKYSSMDIALFLVLPAIISGFLLLACNMPLTSGMIVVLVTSFSIFAALLFNLLLLTYDIVVKSNNGKEKREDVNDSQGKSNGSKKLTVTEKLLKETYINISFCITISLISIILLIILYFFVEAETAANLGKNIPSFLVNSLTYTVPFFSFLVYYLSSQFMLTLLMIIKRINVLLSKQFV
jgi:hypothetical protein